MNNEINITEENISNNNIINSNCNLSTSNDISKESSLSNFIQDTENSFSLEKSLKTKNTKKLSYFFDINDHFICRNCKTVPIINFVSLKNVDCSCSCYEIKNMSINDVFIKYIVRDIEVENGEIVNNNIENYLKCNKHMKNYLYYCKICQKNLCRNCLSETNIHKIHSLFIFDLNIFELNEKKKCIYEILMNKLNNSFFEKKINTIDTLFTLLNIIYNDFLYHTNYSHFRIFSNLKEFFDKFIIDKTNDEDIQEFDLKKEIKINNKRDLLDPNLKPEIILEIRLKRCNFNDITELCKLNLKNLKILYLFENCIVNIEPLTKANFTNLENLDLGANKLSNDSIPYLNKLNFEKLKELNLYLNNFTDYNIFKFKNNKKCLPALKVFYLGSNVIDWKNGYDEEQKLSEIYDFSSIKTIGLTNGIFDKITIKYIKNFIFTNLETLYLSRNNFTSLSFIKKLELPSIKNFYLHSSFIKEFYPLVKYKKLEIINLTDNDISDINKLELFIKELPNLKEFSLIGNKINMNDENNKKILNSVYKNIRTNIILQ